jgi:hypothetical protein
MGGIADFTDHFGNLAVFNDGHNMPGVGFAFPTMRFNVFPNQCVYGFFAHAQSLLKYSQIV